MKYYVVRTPTKICEFVTEKALDNGGQIVRKFKKQVKAVSLADRLNREKLGGYYCVMIKD